MRLTRHIVLHGRVQGVFFRESLRQEANARGIAGWVRNRLDGSVEAVLQGEQALVDALIDWARTGPPGASVERIVITDTEGEYRGFERRPTA